MSERKVKILLYLKIGFLMQKKLVKVREFLFLMKEFREIESEIQWVAKMRLISNEMRKIAISTVAYVSEKT